MSYETLAAKDLIEQLYSVVLGDREAFIKDFIESDCSITYTRLTNSFAPRVAGFILELAAADAIKRGVEPTEAIESASQAIQEQLKMVNHGSQSD